MVSSVLIDKRYESEPDPCPRRSGCAAKDTHKRGQMQVCLRFAERKYLGRSQRYEKSSAEASGSLIMPRRSILDECQRYEKTPKIEPQHTLFARPHPETVRRDAAKEMPRTRIGTPHRDRAHGPQHPCPPRHEPAAEPPQNRHRTLPQPDLRPESLPPRPGRAAPYRILLSSGYFSPLYPEM